MAQISRKKSIIKTRVASFHAKPKAPTKKERILSAVAKPAEFIHKQATSERGKKIISGVGSFLRGWGEAARAAGKRQYGGTKKAKHKKKTTKKKHSRGKTIIIRV